MASGYKNHEHQKVKVCEYFSFNFEVYFLPAWQKFMKRWGSRNTISYATLVISVTSIIFKLMFHLDVKVSFYPCHSRALRELRFCYLIKGLHSTKLVFIYFISYLYLSSFFFSSAPKQHLLEINENEVKKIRDVQHIAFRFVRESRKSLESAF